MGCFPACFGQWRHQETKKKVQDHVKTQCLSPSHELLESVKLLPAATESVREEEIVDPMKLVSESEGKCEEHMNKSNEKKAVFDHSNVKTGTNELTSRNSDKLVENENGEFEKKTDKGKDDGSDFSSRIPYSANHGHHDYLISDKECVAVNLKEITLECCPVQEESSESLFSLSIDSRKQAFAAEMGDKEVNSPLKPSDRENTSKKIGNFLKYDEDKENVPLSKEPIIKQSFDKSKPISDHQFKKRDSEIVLDTSLSSWLVESEKSAHKTSLGNSPESEKNYGDRQILGAVTSHAELTQLNESSSAGSTPCCSVDDQPGIGTVGRYWRQRGRAGPVVDMGLGSSCRATG